MDLCEVLGSQALRAGVKDGLLVSIWGISVPSASVLDAYGICLRPDLLRGFKISGRLSVHFVAPDTAL